MGKFVERVKAHYAAMESRTIEVPEWKVTFVIPPMTLGQQAALFSNKQIAEKEGKQLSLFVETLILRCYLQDGSRAFDESDREALTNEADGEVVQRVATEIMSAPGVEEVKKS